MHNTQVLSNEIIQIAVLLFTDHKARLNVLFEQNIFLFLSGTERDGDRGGEGWERERVMGGEGG